MREPKPIKLNELLKKLDELRSNGSAAKVFTPEMEEVLRSARTGAKTVPYVRLAKFWEEAGWGHVSKSTLKNKWDRMNESEKK